MPVDEQNKKKFSKAKKKLKIKTGVA